MTSNPISKKVGDTHTLVLTNRGSAGLSIQWKLSDDTLAAVERLEHLPTPEAQPGDAIQTQYQITLLKKGQVAIHFYETHIWDNDFPDLPLEEFIFVVA